MTTLPCTPSTTRVFDVTGTAAPLAFSQFEAPAPAHPSDCALMWENDLGEVHAFTADELEYWANKTANFLAGLGVGVGDAVAVSLRRHYQLWFVDAALEKLGADLVRVPESADEAEMGALLRSSGAKALLATNQGRVAEVAEHVVYLCPSVSARVLVNGDGASALFDDSEGEAAFGGPAAYPEDGLPHGPELSGSAGVCALGCVRPGWIDFNTHVRVAPSAPVAAGGADTCAGASLVGSAA